VAKERDGKREKFWRRMLRGRARSGLTIVEFCASEGLKTTAYQYWQREIKRRDAESPLQVTEPISGPALVPVQLVDDGSSTAAVEIIAGNGYVIRVSEQATTEHLRRVLQAVGELS
jgi:hypothetical protein